MKRRAIAHAMSIFATDVIEPRGSLAPLYQLRIHLPFFDILSGVRLFCTYTKDLPY